MKLVSIVWYPDKHQLHDGLSEALQGHFGVLLLRCVSHITHEEIFAYSAVRFAPPNAEV